MFVCASWIALATSFVVMACWAWIFKKRHLTLPLSRPIPSTCVHPLQHLSAVQLSKRYENGTLTPSFVVATYIAHIKKVNPFVNAMVFDRFDLAMMEAVKADEIWMTWRKSSRKDLKPSWLTGVPCTIKECIQVQGCPNSSGHPYRKHIISACDAPTVQRLRKAGAIVLGVTNTSQLCMWMESNNKVYGVTNNCYDTRRLVGGSSGGEACAVSAFFAPFGLGSDIGGSIRMPAFFNGIFGFKPSVHLIPNNGQHPGARDNGKLHSVLTTGPLCRFSEDLLPLSLVLSEGGFLQDPELFPPCPPLRQELLNLGEWKKNNKPLRVFAIEDFGLPFIHVAPSQIRAVHDAAVSLQQTLGATVTVLNMRDSSRCSSPVPHGWELFSQIVQMWGTLVTSDPEEQTFSQLMSEGMENEIKPFREVVAWARGRSSHTLMSILLTCWERIETRCLPEFLKERNRTNLGIFKAALQRELGDDAIIICPTYPLPAPKHHDPSWMPFQWQYTGAFNCTGLPVTSVPMWDASLKDVDVIPSADECRERGLPNDFHVPKGVQIVAAWGNDMLCLSVAAELEKANVGKFRHPSWTVTPKSFTV
jgi:fatty acid amide hydrolase 2